MNHFQYFFLWHASPIKDSFGSFSSVSFAESGSDVLYLLSTIDE